MENDYIFPYFYHDDDKPELQHHEIIKNYSLQAEEMDNYIKTLPDAYDIMEEIIEWRNNLAKLFLSGEKFYRGINRFKRLIESEETYPFIDDEARLELLNTTDFKNFRLYNNLWCFVYDDNTGKIIFLGYFTPNELYPNCQTLNVVHLANLESENFLRKNPIVTRNTFRTLSYCLREISKKVRFTIVLPEDVALSFFSAEHFTIEPIEPGWSLILSYKIYEKGFLPLSSNNLKSDLYFDSVGVKIYDSISTELMTISDLLSIIDRIAYDEVKKIMVYYSGISYNGVGTNFPVIPLKDYELTQPELLNILKSKGFSLIIIGYNANNKLKTEFYDVRWKLTAPNGEKIPNNIFDYKGILSFTAASVGGQNFGELFTLVLHHALEITNGDWLLSMQYLSNDEELKEFNMKPYWTIDPGISSYKKWH